MKLALCFLLASFVGLSWEERYVWPSPIAPRAHLMPLFYADGQPAGFSANHHEANTDEKKVPGNPTEEKILFGLLGANKPAIYLSTVTKTSFSTVVSAISTPVTAKCIPTYQFFTTIITTTIAPGTTNTLTNTLTAACARRRRSVENEEVVDHILPDEPIPLEPTAAEPMPAAAHHQEVSILPEPGMIQSSQSENGLVEQRFLGPDSTSTVWVTVPTTVYSFVPLTVKVTASVGAGVNALLCLPSGYMIC